MAPGGSSCMTVLVAVGLLPLCMVPAELLELWQPDPVLFVEPGAAVSIRCMADEGMDGAGKVLWYRRRPREPPQLLLSCIDATRDGFSCEYRRETAVLHIQAAHPKDAALYLCANAIVSKLQFSNGTVLLVGDSWRTHSWVQVLATRGSPQSPLSPICAVGASGGPVLISWLGGDRPQEVLGLGNSTELLLSPGRAGELCEVRFNASGPHIQRSTELHAAAGEHTARRMGGKEGGVTPLCGSFQVGHMGGI
uniref:Ig-like domain-containing protein n=1 Tax=Pavo cristatus TaxID=9049 RepID=A0A8C9ENJ1_PAVCR